MAEVLATIAREVARRRTFAIISHPDAGKTTLTEKLLLYGGAIHQAGSVVAKAGQAHATSDWMSLEQQRGISISSSALQFDYQGHRLNLLDTPGHQDFSEDTYRTLIAADSAVMLLDAARGVQAQTEKLFAVCRQRGIPSFTFINKLDRPALDPFALLEEVERVLGVTAVPITWPIGDGPTFRGVYERGAARVHLFEKSAKNFEKSAKNAARAPLRTAGLDDPLLRDLLGDAAHAKLREDIEIVEGLIAPFDHASLAAGRITPVFFGSVLTNFGVQVFLEHFLKWAPPPGGLEVVGGRILPVDATFTAFVFKVQANLNRRHRDRTAFVRVASGRFERGMEVIHTRSGRSLRLARAHSLFAQERSTVEEAYPGDIVGLVNPGLLRVGDVLSQNKRVRLASFPRFVPERFMMVRPKDADRRKAFRKGLTQLAEEGVVQLFYPSEGARDPVLGAVGDLQFEVFEHRMLEEYGVAVQLTPDPHTMMRWLDKPPAGPTRFGHLLSDDQGRPVLLFKGQWEMSHTAQHHPELRLSALPDGDRGVQV